MFGLARGPAGEAVIRVTTVTRLLALRRPARAARARRPDPRRPRVARAAARAVERAATGSPADAWPALADAGLLGVGLPEAVGGGGAVVPRGAPRARGDRSSRRAGPGAREHRRRCAAHRAWSASPTARRSGCTRRASPATSILTAALQEPGNDDPRPTRRPRPTSGRRLADRRREALRAAPRTSRPAARPGAHRRRRRRVPRRPARRGSSSSADRNDERPSTCGLPHAASGPAATPAAGSARSRRTSSRTRSHGEPVPDRRSA